MNDIKLKEDKKVSIYSSHTSGLPMDFPHFLKRFEVLLDHLVKTSSRESVNYNEKASATFLATKKLNDLSRLGLWETFWNKPFYRGIKVSTGTKWEKTIEKLLPRSSSYEAIDFFSSIDTEFSFEVKDWKHPKNYQFSGKNANAVFRLNPKFPRDRLFQVCKFANRLQHDVDKLIENIKQLYSVLRMTEKSDKAKVHFLKIKSFFGERGWGWITILHGLTDLGYSIKPDIHFMRAHKFLMFSQYHAKGQSRVPTNPEALSLANYYVFNCLSNLDEIKRIIKRVAPSDYKKLSEQDKHEDEKVFLRYLDKIIMDFSFKEYSVIDLNKNNISLNLS